MFRMIICCDGICGCALDDGMLVMFILMDLWRWTGIVVYITGGTIGVKTLIINGRSSLCATSAGTFLNDHPRLSSAQKNTKSF